MNEKTNLERFRKMVWLDVLPKHIQVDDDHVIDISMISELEMFHGKFPKDHFVQVHCRMLNIAHQRLKWLCEKTGASIGDVLAMAVLQFDLGGNIEGDGE